MVVQDVGQTLVAILRQYEKHGWGNVPIRYRGRQIDQVPGIRTHHKNIDFQPGSCQGQVHPVKCHTGKCRKTLDGIG